MKMYVNVKGFSTITLILLIIVSAIIGGLISYAFTIAYYAKIPEETTLTITGVYINKENVRSFNVSVLNPSYSPSDAKVSRIAISLKGEKQLYDVVETKPSVKNGLAISRGEALNITCLKIAKDNVNITFGEFVSTFTGKTIIVHVFAEGSPAANMEVVLPLVKLDIVADFNPSISFKKFNITLINSPQSEVNITITNITPGLITVEEMDPDVRVQPVTISRNESKLFSFNGSWYGVTKIGLSIEAEQGYIFRKEVEMKTAYASIQKVSFNENHTDYFNVTVYNFAESQIPINVVKIECTLRNGTKLPPLDCGSAEIKPNSTKVFVFYWDWSRYRGEDITVVAFFAQDFQTPAYVATTPPPIIVKVLNIASAFDLRDKERFNITILNHASSLEAINVTKILVKKTGAILHVNNGLIDSSFNKTFSCNFNWTGFLKDYGRNLTLTIYATTNETLREYAFDFDFILPVAELDVTIINCTAIGGTRYLNLTIRNLGYSLWNLTLSKIVITVQGFANPLEYVLPKNQTIVNIGCEVILLCPFDWQKYLSKDITVTVVTEELVEASAAYTIPETFP